MSSNYIANHQRGTTWNGMEILLEKEIQPPSSPVIFEPVDLSTVQVVASFREKKGSAVIFEFKTQDGTITIPEPLSGKMNFMPRKMNVPVCTYFFEVLLIQSDGTTTEVMSNYWTIE